MPKNKDLKDTAWPKSAHHLQPPGHEAGKPSEPARKEEMSEEERSRRLFALAIGLAGPLIQKR
jgi:hypothetical protein